MKVNTFGWLVGWLNLSVATIFDVLYMVSILPLNLLTPYSEVAPSLCKKNHVPQPSLFLEQKFSFLDLLILSI